jgi:predicted ribosomally synthesized peptide with SipW-like signal peptide
MAKSRKFLTVGALGVGAMALIGAGATATFTDAASGSQKITAGTMSLYAHSVGGTTSADGRTVTLPAFGPTGSTFQTTNYPVLITNNGNVKVTELSITLSDANDGAANSVALRNQVNVCMWSDPWIVANGALTTGEALNPAVGLNPVDLAPGETETIYVDFYAGMNATRCGNTTSSGPTTGSLWGSYSTPASLTNAAQGGVVTPTMTLHFTG